MPGLGPCHSLCAFSHAARTNPGAFNLFSPGPTNMHQGDRRRTKSERETIMTIRSKSSPRLPLRRLPAASPLRPAQPRLAADGASTPPSSEPPSSAHGCQQRALRRLLRRRRSSPLRWERQNDRVRRLYRDREGLPGRLKPGSLELRSARTPPRLPPRANLSGPPGGDIRAGSFSAKCPFVSRNAEP